MVSVRYLTKNTKKKRPKFDDFSVGEPMLYKLSVQCDGLHSRSTSRELGPWSLVHAYLNIQPGCMGRASVPHAMRLSSAMQLLLSTDRGLKPRDSHHTGMMMYVYLYPSLKVFHWYWYCVVHVTLVYIYIRMLHLLFTGCMSCVMYIMSLPTFTHFLGDFQGNWECVTLRSFSTYLVPRSSLEPMIFRGEAFQWWNVRHDSQMSPLNSQGFSPK